MPGEAAAAEGGIVACTFKDFADVLKAGPSEYTYYLQQTILTTPEPYADLFVQTVHNYKHK